MLKGLRLCCYCVLFGDRPPALRIANSLYRLQLVPLLQELAGGAGALDTRFAELSRQSKLAREMVQSVAESWETQHYTSTECDRSEQSGLRMEAGAPRTGRRLDLFPLVPFLRVKLDEDGHGAKERLLPELVREELLHRFITGAKGSK